jgi:uncharacterized protein YhbP (UPF0306 family)
MVNKLENSNKGHNDHLQQNATYNVFLASHNRLLLLSQTAFAHPHMLTTMSRVHQNALNSSKTFSPANNVHNHNSEYPAEQRTKEEDK